MFFGEYITPSEYLARHTDTDMTLEELCEKSHDDRECENCSNPVWRLASTGLCFVCTTGESDASEDYELIPENYYGDEE